MNKPFLVLIIFFGLEAFSQEVDPSLIGTWYLYESEVDLGPTSSVSSIEPHIHPELVIDENLGFTGYGACNSFSGTFNIVETNEWESILQPINYTSTDNACDFESHTGFEGLYFSYFSEEIPLYIYLYVDSNTGRKQLSIENYPGFILNFQNEPLVFSIPEKNTEIVSIYPNPVSRTLYLSHKKGGVFQKIEIYSLTGKRVFSTTNSSGEIEVSGFANGAYFLKVYSAGKVTVSRFEKK